MLTEQAYEPDRSIVGKLRRRLVKAYSRRPLPPADGPRLSFSFDDVPASAALTGAQVLNERGVKGSYYIAGGLTEQDDGPMGPHARWEDIRRLHAQGHEIGCHSFSHLDCGKASAAEADADTERNRAAFAAHGLPAPVTFAWPYGDVAPGPKAALARRFVLMRAVHHGLMRPGSDMNQAPSVCLAGPGGEAETRAWIHRAAQSGAWLIVNTHDVADQPSRWGCTPDGLARLLDEALALGFRITTVAEGASAR